MCAVDDLRTRYEEYHAAAARESYAFRSGRKPTLELDEVDRRFADVTEGDHLSTARREEEGASFDQDREGWRRLRCALEAHQVSARVRPVQRELQEREAQQRAPIDGDERTLFSWQATLGREDDHVRRGRIQDALDSGAEDLNPLRCELRSRAGQLWAELGYPTPRARAEVLHPGVDYDAWGAAADRILAETDSVYRDGLARALSEIGVPGGAAQRSDAPRVSSLHRYERFFPAGRALDCLNFTTEGMGIRLCAAPDVQVDDEARAGKHPRACCIGPGIPGEIYVVLAPHGGVDDYETLFHEAGHALHFAYTSGALRVEQRILMDPALTETWAFLLHYRIADPSWIPDSPVASRAEPFERAVRFRKLALLRRYAAKIRYELELFALPWEADPRGLADRYAAELTAGTGYRYRESAYLADTDPFFYSVDYLRAWCLEVQIVEQLRERFGRRFWRERGCGELLKELWNTGSTYTADGIADQLGLGAIDPDPLIAELSLP